MLVFRRFAMAEKRICPVCKSAIPAHTKFMCPKCYFDLSRMEDEKAIDREKQKYTERLKTKEKSKEKDEIPSHQSYRAGILGGFGLALIVSIISGVSNRDLEEFFELLVLFAIVYLPGGLVAGFISNLMAKRYVFPRDERKIVVISALLGAILSVVFFFVFMYYVLSNFVWL
jgi:hypothetical protein